MIMTIFLYFICSTINVILNTLKGLFLVKYDSKFINCGINAITFGFYTIVLKQIADIDLITAVVVTVLTNIIGVYASLEIMNRIETETKLYKISMTLRDKIIEKDLKQYKLEYALNTVIYKEVEFYNIEVYAKGKTEKNIIRELIKKYSIKNFNIIELKIKF